MSFSIEEFTTVVRNLFRDNAVDIDAQTKFRNLEEWSSMQALLVIAAIDEHFGVTLPEKDFRNAVTISDLFELTIRPSK